MDFDPNFEPDFEQFLAGLRAIANAINIVDFLGRVFGRKRQR